MADSFRISSRTDFFSLPPSVRNRIYSFAGLVRSCAIDVASEARRWSKLRSAYKRHRRYYYDREALNTKPYQPVINWQTHHARNWEQHMQCTPDMKLRQRLHREPGQGCIHPMLPVQLLRVSRAIQAEAVALLYMENTYMFGPRAIKYHQLRLDLLVSVEIHLTCCSCITGHQCSGLDVIENHNGCKLCHYGCKRGPGKPLCLGDDETTKILENWHVFCKSLRESQAGNLGRFTLICDCDDLETASAIVAPLHGLLVIQDATIRLGQSYNQHLGNLAKRIVYALIREKRNHTFPYLRLPNELQQSILRFTDLVAPDDLSWHEPRWSDDYGNGSAYHENTYRGLSLLSNKQGDCCLQCTQSLEVCACPLRHSAYSSRLCRCWHFPMSLFLVSKSLHKQAASTFLSLNRFVLWESYQILVNGKPLPKDQRLMKPIHFLRELPQSHLTNIRWLCVRGRDFDYKEGLTGSACYDAWITFSTLLKERMLIAQLSLDLDLEENDCWSGEGVHVPLGEEDILAESVWKIVELFQPAMNVYYKNFFIRLAHGVSTMEEDWSRWHLEKQLEQFIMGPDYNAAVRGKYGDGRYYNESIQPKRFWCHKEDMELTDERLYLP